MTAENEAKDKKGLIFDIERFATEDGPGIRTVVFFKGCGLKCLWCANPESQSAKPEVMLIPHACRQCGACIRACPAQAIQTDAEYGLKVNGGKCIRCGACALACVYNARQISGQWMDVSDVMDVVLRDRQYYQKSGGGVTYSGGEPLLQAEFIKQLSTEMKKQGIPVLLETCGEAPWSAFEKTIGLIDTIYYDIKQMDSERHRELTGRSNERIIQNLRKLDEVYTGGLSVRYPYIPGCNDDEASIRSFLRFAGTLKNAVKIVFLPYHRLGISKYKGLGRPYAFPELETLKKSDLKSVAEIAADYGMNIEIGG